MESFLLKVWGAWLFLGRVTNWIRVYGFGKYTSGLHRARFAGTHELGTLLSLVPTPDSLLLGIRRYTRSFCLVRSTSKRRELGNMLVVAPTRGGKGLLAVSQLLSWKYSVVVNDIKGELFTQTAGFRSTLGKVLVIDPSGVGHRFDPLHGKLSEDEFYSAASQLLFEADERERIFTERATVMLTQLFLAARAEGVPAFLYLRFLLRLGLDLTAARINTIDPDLATQFLGTVFTQANLTDRFLVSCWGTLTTRMRPLLTEIVVRTLTHTDFTPQELMCSDQPVSVYIRWKEQDLLALSPLVRLIWGTIINELIATYDQQQGKNCQPVLLLIDEAGRTAIPGLSDQATTVAGRGITLWIAIQSLAQLETVYGKARANVLRDNMESQIYYRPSNQETADYLEHCLGRVSAYARSQTSRIGAEPAQGLTEQGVPLLTAQEIKQLKDEEIIGFHRWYPPFRLHRVDWRDHPLLKSRHGLPPPQLRKLAGIAEMPLLAGTGSAEDRHFPNGFIDPDGKWN